MKALFKDPRVLMPLACLLSAAAAVLVTFVVYEITGADARPAVNPAPSETAEETETEPAPVHEEAIGRYLMAGTIVWDRGVESVSRRTDGSMDYEYPFRGLATYGSETYDAWVADLECPISSDDVPPELGETTLEFNCLPEFLPYAKEYFQFFNLANNHSDNSGRVKLEDTRRLLEAVGIQHFGDPEPGNKDLSCEVVALPVRVRDSAGGETPAELPVAFCAWHYFYRLPLEGEIEVMKEYAELMPVFAFLHMGAEYAAEADGVQQTLARRVIDAGADFVIANNPHWVQNAELYKDKLIVYSTGNFIFDQAFNEEVKRSASIIVDISAEYDESLAGWLELGPACAAFGDDCLSRAEQLGLERPDFEIDFDVVAGYLINHQQAVGDSEVEDAVRERLGWGDLFDAARPVSEE